MQTTEITLLARHDAGWEDVDMLPASIARLTDLASQGYTAVRLEDLDGNRRDVTLTQS